MIRPALKKGDLIKLAKGSSHAGVRRDDMFKVTAFSYSKVVALKCRIYCRRGPDTSDGICIVHATNASGQIFKFQRRDVWRVPNQPRHRHRPELDRIAIQHKAIQESLTYRSPGVSVQSIHTSSAGSFWGKRPF